MPIPVWVSTEAPHRRPEERVREAIRPVCLDEVNRLYEERGEAAAQTFCVTHRAIASICMSCGRLFRFVESQGSPGGLSHGWCSTNCAHIGVARAKAG